MKIIAETDRLILRTWLNEDVQILTDISQDPVVMRYFPACQNRQQIARLIEKCRTQQQQCGYSLYAVVLKATQEMIGFTGLLQTDFEAHFTPAIEIGWRLAAAHWNHGYATEAATAVRDLALSSFGLSELVSFTAKINTPSRRVMEKIGMTRQSQDDFNHPKLLPGNPLQRHVLYRTPVMG